MSSVTKWKIFCVTENSWVEGYLCSTKGCPTQCFNVSTHSINVNSAQELEVISKTRVGIIEESTPTGGNFKACSYKITCPQGVSDHAFVYPYPISALSYTFTSSAEHIDDNFELRVGPNTIIGTLTQNANTLDTTLNVSPTVLEYINLGYYINLYDGVNTSNEFLVVDVDTINSTITINEGLNSNFNAQSYIRMTVKTADNFIIGIPSRYEIGKDKIGGSYVRKDTQVVIRYTNNGNSIKNFYFILEYLY